MCCDYSFKVGLTRVDDDVKQEMEEMTSPEYGVNTFMSWMAGRGAMLRDPELMEVRSLVLLY